MKLSEKLLLVANWLEDSENDILVNAEYDEKCLNAVASAFIKAAEAIKECSEEVKELEPSVTPEFLEEMAAVAQAFDESDDNLLKKQASVLDEILITLAAPKDYLNNFNKGEDDRLEQLKKKYKDVKVKLDDINKVSDSLKLIEEAPAYKKYRPMEAPLSQRNCPDHAGVPAFRVGENTVQCVLDKKVYNYDTGFTLLNGSKVPPTSVSEQTKLPEIAHTIFNNRENRLGLDSGN